ncbi:MAG: SDR family oxidoreductase [Pseudoclavibacter sp.]
MSTSSFGTVIVTGGATLIGAGVVECLHEQGWHVIVADIDVEGGQRLADAHERVTFMRTDITDDAQLASLVEAAAAAPGGLVGLVNLAASYVDDGASTSRDDWLRSLDISLVSAAMLAELARPHLASTRGAIVNFTSTSAKVAQTDRWVYPAAKAAMVQLTRSLALDFAADGIRVNSVNLGWTWSAVMDQLSGGSIEKTDRVAGAFHVLGRVGRPKEIGEVVAFLLSDRASVVTGADWAADGGYSAIGPEQTTPAIPLLAAE